MKNINSSRKRELRHDLYVRYSGKCAYCGKPTTKSAGTVDHYIPWSLGGTNEQGNLRWSCYSCNQLKGDLPPEEWERAKPEYSPPPDTSKYAVKVALIARTADRNLRGRVSAQTADAGEQPEQPAFLE